MARLLDKHAEVTAILFLHVDCLPEAGPSSTTILIHHPACGLLVRSSWPLVKCKAWRATTGANVHVYVPTHDHITQGLCE